MLYNGPFPCCASWQSLADVDALNKKVATVWMDLLVDFQIWSFQDVTGVKRNILVILDPRKYLWGCGARGRRRQHTVSLKEAFHKRFSCTKPPIRDLRFFFGYSYRENKTCSEKSRARALRWLVYTVGKVMFSSHDLKTWLFQHDPMTLPTVYTNYLKALAMLFSEQVKKSLLCCIGVQ